MLLALATGLVFACFLTTLLAVPVQIGLYVADRTGGTPGQGRAWLSGAIESLGLFTFTIGFLHRSPDVLGIAVLLLAFGRLLGTAGSSAWLRRIAATTSVTTLCAITAIALARLL